MVVKLREKAKILISVRSAYLLVQVIEMTWPLQAWTEGHLIADQQVLFSCDQIKLLGDRSTYMWTICPRSLYERAIAESNMCPIDSITSPVFKPLCHHCASTAAVVAYTAHWLSDVVSKVCSATINISWLLKKQCDTVTTLHPYFVSCLVYDQVNVTCCWL